MAKPKLFNYVAATVIVFLLGLYYYQSKYPSHVVLRLGEYVDRRFPVPVIAATGDSECSESTTCSSSIESCVKRTFTVEKDTLYFLTTGFSPSDSARAVCQSCGSILEGTSVLASGNTSCFTKGPVVTSVFLKQGVSYTLVACLNSCPESKGRQCGENAAANAAVSLQKIF